MFDIELTKQEQKRLDDLIQGFIKEVIHQHDPKFNLKYHSESWILSWLLKPFIMLINKSFYQQTSLYFGNTLWVPESFKVRNQFEILRLLAHEYVHAYDKKKLSRPVFYFLYLIPQIFFFPSLLLGFISPWLLFVAPLFLLPLPAYFRYRFELKAYLVNKLFNYHVFYMDESVTTEDIVWRLTSMNYYKAWPFKSSIRNTIMNGTDFSKAPYKEIVDFLRKNDLIE